MWLLSEFKDGKNEFQISRKEMEKDSLYIGLGCSKKMDALSSKRAFADIMTSN